MSQSAVKKEAYYKMLNWYKSATLVSKTFLKALETKRYRLEVLNIYWLKCKETVKYLMTEPKSKKRIKVIQVFSIYLWIGLHINKNCWRLIPWCPCVRPPFLNFHRNELMEQYLTQYTRRIGDAKFKFREFWRQNPAKGLLAKFVYNILKAKKEKEGMNEKEIIGMKIQCYFWTHAVL